MKSKIGAVLAATGWIGLMEFGRNTYLLHGHWQEHYAAMGQVFPESPTNGAMWGLWSLLVAWFIYRLSRRFTFAETVGLSWMAAFAWMWLVIGNLGVLPYAILPWAVPLSLLEVLGATWLITRLLPVENPKS